MREEQPATFSAYFSQQLGKLKQWVTPDPADPVMLSILKTILKSFVVLLMITISPVLILALTIAFFAAF